MTSTPPPLYAVPARDAAIASFLELLDACRNAGPAEAARLAQELGARLRADPDLQRRLVAALAAHGAPVHGLLGTLQAPPPPPAALRRPWLSRRATNFICAVIGLGAAPLAFELVGPNAWYGVRTAATLSDEATWVTCNRIAGFLAMGGMAAVAGLVHWLPPSWGSRHRWGPLLLLAGGIALPVLGVMLCPDMRL